MKPSVVCPACEVEVPVPNPQGASIQCPLCGYEFQLAGASFAEWGKPSAKSPATDFVPAPRKIIDRQKRERAASVAEDSISNTAQAPEPTPADQSSEPSIEPVSLADARSRGQRKSWWIPTIACLVLVSAMAAAIAYQFWPESKPPVARSKQMPAFPVSPSPSSPNSQSESAAATGDSTANAPSASVSQPIDWNTMKLASREEYYSLWTRLQPHLVRLQVTSPRGSRTVGGVILDSRGFVATSFHAVRDAIRVDVSLPGRSFDAGNSAGEMTDQVRGLVAKDEKNDLAILAINRRLISSFGTLKTPGNESVLPGDRCVAAIPPTEKHPTWLVDFAIRQVLPFAQLASENQAPIQQLNLESEGGVTWIVGELPADRIAPGSPIFNFSGELIALATSAQAGTRVAACPARNAFELLGTAGKSMQAFPIDSSIAEAVRASAQNSAMLDHAMPDEASPGFSQAVAVRDHFQALLQSGFVPSTHDQYLKLVQFADSVLTLDDLLQTGEWTDEQYEQTRTFLDKTLDQFQDEWSRSEPDRDWSDMSQWAWDSLNQRHPLVAVAEVIRVGIDDQGAAPYVIMRLADHNEHLFSAVRFDGPVFLPGSRWLLIGEGRTRLDFRSNDGVSMIDARVLVIKYVLAMPTSEPQ